jgi:hypothetical protein
VESCRGTPVPARCSSASPRHPAATRVARLAEQGGGARRVLRHTLARGVQRAEPRAAHAMSAVACALEQRGRTNGIARHPATLLHEPSEARAAVHPATLASALVQRDGAHRVALHPGAPVVHEAEAGARIADRPIARAAEQRGGSRIVLEDVLALLEPRGETVARGQVTRLAREIELFGFLTSRVAGGEARECERDQEPGVCERGGQTWGGRRHPGAAWAGAAGEGRKQAIRRVRVEVSCNRPSSRASAVKCGSLDFARDDWRRCHPERAERVEGSARSRWLTRRIARGVHVAVTRSDDRTTEIIDRAGVSRRARSPAV